MDRLIAQVPGLAGRVYGGQVTETVPFPYATLGPSDWVPEDAECIEGRRYSVQIDLWASAASKGPLEDLVDDVSSALHHWSGALASHPTVAAGWLSVTLAQVMDDPSPGVLHGVVQVEAAVES